MALESTSGSGIRFVMTPPDPLKVRKELAEIAAQEGAPGVEQQKIGIEQQNVQRQMQALMAQTAQGREQLKEEARWHTAQLAEGQKTRDQQFLLEQSKLAGTMAESAADRAARGGIAGEQLKAGRFGDVLSHLGPTLAQTPGAMEAVAALMGAPEVGQGLGEAKRKAAIATGTALVGGAKTEADVDKLVGTLPKDPTTGQPDPVASNAAWNTWKAAHGDKAAADALAAPAPTPAGTPTGAASPPAAPAEGVGWRSTPLSVTGTPEMVKTEDRGLVKPSMGVVGLGGGTLPIPGATPGRYGETATEPTVSATPGGAQVSSPSRMGLLMGAPPSGVPPTTVTAAPSNVPTNEGMQPTPPQPPTPAAQAGQALQTMGGAVDQATLGMLGAAGKALTPMADINTLRNTDWDAARKAAQQFYRGVVGAR